MRDTEDGSAWSVSQCIVFLKNSFRDKDFEKLEAILTSKFEDLKQQLVVANTKYENERLQRIAAEEDQTTMCECALFRAKAVNAEMRRDELQEEVKRLTEQNKELPDLRRTVLELKVEQEESKSSSEELASARKRIHELECENTKLAADWRKEREGWHERVSSLEKDVEYLREKASHLMTDDEDLQKQETLEKEMARADEHLSNGGNGRSPSQSIVEIVGSDDDSAAEVISNVKAITVSQNPARSSGSSHEDCEKGSRNLKRRRDEAFNSEEGYLSSRGDKVDTVSGHANSQQDKTSLRPCEGVSGSKPLSRDLMSRITLKGSFNDYELSSDSGDSDYDYDSDRCTQISEMVDGLKTSTELCMQAVCALHRMDKNNKRSPLGLRYSNRGFDKSNATRGTALAEFLIDGDTHGQLRKSVTELEAYDPKAVDDCKSIAIQHSKQLFEIYRKKEDISFRQFVDLTAP